MTRYFIARSVLNEGILSTPLGQNTRSRANQLFHRRTVVTSIQQRFAFVSTHTLCRCSVSFIGNFRNCARDASVVHFLCRQMSPMKRRPDQILLVFSRYTRCFFLFFFFSFFPFFPFPFQIVRSSDRVGT